jgi:hypothetical protein
LEDKSFCSSNSAASLPASQKPPEITRPSSAEVGGSFSWGWQMTLPSSEPKYDRDFLLSPDKRDQLIELWELEKYGQDCSGDPDHVHLYGMAPRPWWERGVRSQSMVAAI